MHRFIVIGIDKYFRHYDITHFYLITWTFTTQIYFVVKKHLIQTYNCFNSNASYRTKKTKTFTFNLFTVIHTRIDMCFDCFLFFSNNAPCYILAKIIKL